MDDGLKILQHQLIPVTRESKLIVIGIEPFTIKNNK